MDVDFKEIHIGEIIRELVDIKKIEEKRVSNFFNKPYKEIQNIYSKKTIDSDELLKWSKLLEYNLFMYYHTHLQLYSPKSVTTKIIETSEENKKKYVFKKNYYTHFIKEFILCLIKDNKMSISEIINCYNIPRTTIYRWLKKKDEKKIIKETSIKEVCGLNYARIYTDFINSVDGVSVENKNKLLKMVSAIKNYNDLVKITNTIAEFLPNNFNTSDFQQLKAFDKSRIIKILKEQRDNNYSNIEISKKYKISRNTIAKWIKEFPLS